jgi:hypothetical protein
MLFTVADVEDLSKKIRDLLPSRQSYVRRLGGKRGRASCAIAIRRGGTRNALPRCWNRSWAAQVGRRSFRRPCYTETPLEPIVFHVLLDCPRGDRSTGWKISQR